MTVKLAPSSSQQTRLCFTTKCIKSIGDDAFVFHCASKLDPYKINRNVIVLKTFQECNTKKSRLTVINPLLLTPAGEKALLGLGKIQQSEAAR